MMGDDCEYLQLPHDIIVVDNGEARASFLLFNIISRDAEPNLGFELLSFKFLL